MKKLTLLAIASLIAVSLSACGGNSKQAESTKPASTDVTTETPSNTTDVPEVDKPETTPETIPEKPAEQTIKFIYNGRVDMNFIEVSFDDGTYGIMQLSDSIKNSFDSYNITEGASVTATYIEKDGQKVITGIDK